METADEAMQLQMQKLRARMAALEDDDEDEEQEDESLARGGGQQQQQQQGEWEHMVRSKALYAHIVHGTHEDSDSDDDSPSMASPRALPMPEDTQGRDGAKARGFAPAISRQIADIMAEAQTHLPSIADSDSDEEHDCDGDGVASDEEEVLDIARLRKRTTATQATETARPGDVREAWGEQTYTHTLVQRQETDNGHAMGPASGVQLDVSWLDDSALDQLLAQLEEQQTQGQGTGSDNGTDTDAQQQREGDEGGLNDDGAGVWKGFSYENDYAEEVEHDTYVRQAWDVLSHEYVDTKTRDEVEEVEEVEVHEKEEQEKEDKALPLHPNSSVTAEEIAMLLEAAPTREQDSSASLAALSHRKGAWDRIAQIIQPENETKARGGDGIPVQQRRPATRSSLMQRYEQDEEEEDEDVDEEEEEDDEDEDDPLAWRRQRKQAKQALQKQTRPDTHVQQMTPSKTTSAGGQPTTPQRTPTTSSQDAPVSPETPHGQGTRGEDGAPTGSSVKKSRSKKRREREKRKRQRLREERAAAAAASEGTMEETEVAEDTPERRGARLTTAQQRMNKENAMRALYMDQHAVRDQARIGRQRLDASVAREEQSGEDDVQGDTSSTRSWADAVSGAGRVKSPATSSASLSSSSTSTTTTITATRGSGTSENGWWTTPQNTSSSSNWGAEPEDDVGAFDRYLEEEKERMEQQRRERTRGRIEERRGREGTQEMLLFDESISFEGELNVVPAALQEALLCEDTSSVFVETADAHTVVAIEYGESEEELGRVLDWLLCSQRAFGDSVRGVRMVHSATCVPSLRPQTILLVLLQMSRTEAVDALLSVRVDDVMGNDGPFARSKSGKSMLDGATYMLSHRKREVVDSKARGRWCWTPLHPLRVFTAPAHMGVMSRGSAVDVKAQHSVCVVNPTLDLRKEGVLYQIVAQAHECGLDIVAMGLKYPSAEEQTLLRAHTLLDCFHGPAYDQAGTHRAVRMGARLVFALRGVDAVQRWSNAVGPDDPALARITDPDSLRARLGGGNKSENVVEISRTLIRAHKEMAFWFGGRVPPTSTDDAFVDDPSLYYSAYESAMHTMRVAGTSVKSHAASTSEEEEEEEEDGSPSLGTTDESAVVVHEVTVGAVETSVLLVSCLLSMLHVVPLLEAVQAHGLHLTAIRRKQLDIIDVDVLEKQGRSVCEAHADLLDEANEQGQRPFLLLQVQSENAVARTVALHAALQRLQRGSDAAGLTWFMPHTRAWAQTMSGHFFGDDVHLTPNRYLVEGRLMSHEVYSSAELPQMLLVALTPDTLRKGNTLAVLRQLLGHPDIHPDTTEFARNHFECMGIKLLPALARYQAQELTPVEVGDAGWTQSLSFLQSGPVLLVVCRAVNAFARMHDLVGSVTQAHTLRGLYADSDIVECALLSSPNPEQAYRQISMFFEASELTTEPVFCLPLERMLPRGILYGSEDAEGHGLLDAMVQPPEALATVLVIKPSVAPMYLPKILLTLANEGFVVERMRMMRLDEQLASFLFASQVAADERALMVAAMANAGSDGGGGGGGGGGGDGGGDPRSVRAAYVHLMCSGPVIALLLRRENGVQHALRIVGHANPKQARLESQFSLRGVFGGTGVHDNGFQASTSYYGATQDVVRVFGNTHDDKEESTGTQESSAQEGLCVLQRASSLLETVAVVITWPFLRPKSARWLESVLELVLRQQEFALVGMRTCALDNRKAQRVAELLAGSGSHHHHHHVDPSSSSSSSGWAEKGAGEASTWVDTEEDVEAICAALTGGQVLVLALERTSAVYQFGHLLRHGELKSLLDNLWRDERGLNGEEDRSSASSADSRRAWASWSNCIMSADSQGANEGLVTTLFDAETLFGDNTLVGTE